MIRRTLLAAVLLAVPALSSAQQPCTTDARRVVDELYRHMLERAADPGSAGWVTKLQSGTTVREIVRDIAKSSEHAQRFYNPGEGQVAHERAVATLYRHILGRQPDEAGLRALTQQAMDRGLESVVDAILGSSEYNQNFGDWGVPGSGGIRYCGSQGLAGNARSREMRFPDWDTNHDGVVSRSEWRGSANGFRIRDWNGDGRRVSSRRQPRGARLPHEHRRAIQLSRLRQQRRGHRARMGRHTRSVRSARSQP
jgi:hypothetical protein